MDFHFTARCGEQATPLQVSMPYAPGNQAPKARLVAVGELLAALDCKQASVDASHEGVVTVTIGPDIWVIDEARAKPATRGAV